MVPTRKLIGFEILGLIPQKKIRTKKAPQSSDTAMKPPSMKLES